jgi:cobalt-zinc-cadmium efflux system outer membrane protein
MFKRTSALLLGFTGFLMIGLPSLAAAQEAGISLQDALNRALQSSPRLEAARAAVRAGEGEKQQAGAWQNPNLNLEAENFAGSDAYSGFKSAETTVGVSQTIDWSDKAGYRVAVAEEGSNLHRIDYAIAKADLISDVHTAYANAVAAQERLRMAREQKELAEKLYEEVAERISAAREPDIQKSKAQITLSTARFAQEKAQRELEHAKHVLASTWGGHEGAFNLQPDYFYTLSPPMTEKAAEQALDNSPYMKRALTEQNRMQAIHELEQAQALPDPTVGVGVRDFRATESQALIASVSIPLPVMNMNSGGIAKARENVSKAASDARTRRISLVNDLHEALESMTNAHGNASNLKTSILPAAEKAFSQARKGYNAGKFAYLEVLDAQRTLFDVKAQYIDTLNEYHKSKATLTRLTSPEAQDGKNE